MYHLFPSYLPPPLSPPSSPRRVSIHLFHELLRGTNMDIIGVGGVASGQDAFEMILCGCSAVQLGTAFWTEGEQVGA